MCMYDGHLHVWWYLMRWLWSVHTLHRRAACVTAQNASLPPPDRCHQQQEHGRSQQKPAPGGGFSPPWLRRVLNVTNPVSARGILQGQSCISVGQIGRPHPHVEKSSWPQGGGGPTRPSLSVPFGDSSMYCCSVLRDERLLARTNHLNRIQSHSYKYNYNIIFKFIVI
jgi:hypothetical protein